VAGEGRPKRSAYSWVAAVTLFVGSVLFFVQDEAAWLKVLRVALLVVSVIAFTIEARRLKAARQRSL
jgi:uncharacterized membrane protein YhaH (DUF805 family)